ncbi:MAG: DUF192 domain-containing protein [Pseudomonadota bacterium]
MIVFSWALALSGAHALAACAPDRVDLRGAFGTARFTVELADEPQERSQGLMFRESMPTGAGMLFLYERPQRATFWMRNTLIPLDMIFMDPTGTVTHVHANAVPLDETTIDGGIGVLAVLEINGGLAQAIGIAEGTELRHPSLDQAVAAWPCE